ncbi:hypothetical protein WJX74_005225 [Apatococcus lobatus]|uniref:Uncharacterized protein n=1 Tax=Apatococcus lobatus TaxID=904363 RepID=A0AAW1QGV6_9CHLO
MADRRRQQSAHSQQPFAAPQPRAPTYGFQQAQDNSRRQRDGYVAPPEPPAQPLPADSEQITTETGAVDGVLQEFQSRLRRDTEQAVQEATAGARDKTMAHRHRLREAKEDLEKKRKSWELEKENEVKALEDMVSNKRRAVDASEQQVANDRAEAAALLNRAQQISDAAKVKQDAAHQATKSADLNMLSARRQLAQMVLWAGTLAYAIWFMHTSAGHF